MATMDVSSCSVGGLAGPKQTVVACRSRVRSGDTVAKEGKSFGTTPAELRALGAWLGEWQVSQVAMESTGGDWKPVWTLLEGHAERLLVNARPLKRVPGRKTDVKDCAWMAQLLQDGLLRGSCVPSPEVRPWRALPRHRTKRSEQHTAVVNRVHKTLEDANLTRGAVSSDIMGVSGRRMLRAMAAGQEDAAARAALGQARFQATQAALPASLQGTITAHPRVRLATLLEQVELLEQQSPRLDERIEECRRPVEAPIRRLDSRDGVDRRGAQNLLAELGPDRAQFPEAEHLSRGAGRSPGTNESAGKRPSGTTTQGNKWLWRT